MSFKPQRAGGCKRIYSVVLPPRSFITVAMNLTVMGAAERHRELIAHFTAKGTILCEPQAMRIRGPSTANQARLFHDVPDMLAITNATRLGEYQHTFVNLWWPSLFVQTRA
jgi:hypothetical protein